MMHHICYLFILLSAVGLASCRTTADKPMADAASGAISEPMEIARPRGELIAGSRPVNAMPRAVAYRMNGDYAAYVPVTLNADGTLASFPAPSDITAASEPVALGDGWYLDRRGISSASRFTRYTYAEYAALPATPSPAQLLESLLPDARVTQVEVLDMTPAEAYSKRDSLLEIINSRTPRLKVQ